MSGKYLLFAGHHYYPQGGWYDFKAAFESLNDAVSAAEMQEGQWWHIIDRADGKVVHWHRTKHGEEWDG